VWVCSTGNAQKIEARPIDITSYEGGRLVAKTDSEILLLTDGGSADLKTHIYSLNNQWKIKNHNTFTHRHTLYDNLFSLGENAFVSKMYENDSKYFHRYYIQKIISPDGQIKDTTIIIFEIDESKDKRLNS